ncbi:hypothetical protein [Stutzerimonas nitrititolerans]|uniref:hypothetical protein n=1 Tax=Stutzerimonas nitrititolerans TaxID=2482751 RepID=UPI00148275A8|nr:hypothetical protein [Stutzerimonas nitrititolerans]NNT92970.1 hypothetical protein [Stutzerimonas nitrititolerans]
MSTNVSIQIQLQPQQAEAYLRWLTSQYEQLMAACWYDDRYRYTPQGLRGKRILEDHPHIAGLNRTMRVLVKELKPQEVQA